MKAQMKIPYIADISEFGSEQLRDVLLSKGAILPLASHNWASEFPYAPDVVARMAYSATALVVMFDVSEEHLRAVELNNNGRVWEDSCVEFFVANPLGEGYYNFECNAIGTLLAAKRISREEATHFSDSALQSIVRFGSLEHKKIDICSLSQWWIAEIIPFAVLGLTSAPKALRANLYKCGDNLLHPHFMSWSAVGCAKPDFHRPEYFGQLTFEEDE